jgi:hypothetical protein
MWILQCADAPAHHDLHPQPNIHAQKLMENAAVGIIAATTVRHFCSVDACETIGAIIKRATGVRPLPSAKLTTGDAR